MLLRLLERVGFIIKWYVSREEVPVIVFTPFWRSFKKPTLSVKSYTGNLGIDQLSNLKFRDFSFVFIENFRNAKKCMCGILCGFLLYMCLLYFSCIKVVPICSQVT